MLASKLAQQARDRGHHLLANSWTDKAREFQQEMAAIHDSIRRMEAMAAREEFKRAS